MKHKQSFSKMLSQYHPIPGRKFHEKMENAPWFEKKEKMSPRISLSIRLGWQIGIAVLLVMAVLSLGIPSVRASLSAWLGLSVAPSSQMPAVTMPAAGPLPTPSAVNTASSPTPGQPALSSEKPVEIAQMSSQAGWNILTPGHLPEGYRFQSAYFDTNHQMVILTYLVTRPLPGATDPSLTASKTITLLQAQKNDFVPMQIAPDTSITDVQVNGQPAVYAVGAWDTQFVKDGNEPQGGKMVSTWRNDLAVKNLYWQSGKVYLLLLTEDETISQQDLIDLADGVRE